MSFISVDMFPEILFCEANLCIHFVYEANTITFLCIIIGTAATDIYI